VKRKKVFKKNQQKLFAKSTLEEKLQFMKKIFAFPSKVEGAICHWNHGNVYILPFFSEGTKNGKEERIY
jgi:hypothetical protein